MGRVLAVQGDVFPSTLHNVNLCADIRLPDGKHEMEIQGESEITKWGERSAGSGSNLEIRAGFPPTVQAILAADLIIIGPGSLYTSLLANLLVPDLRDAIRASRATKILCLQHCHTAW